MQITILNGDMNQDKSGFTSYINDLYKKLEKNNSVSVFHLDNMDLDTCHGCWNCWVKTPGICTTKDEGHLIHKAVINSDLVLFASPLKLGFTSSILKKITERLIVLLHPYIQFINGESHHHKRYENYPDFGLILQKESDTDDEDIKIINDIYDRIALNFHGKVKFTKFIEDDSLISITSEINKEQFSTFTS